MKTIEAHENVDNGLKILNFYNKLFFENIKQPKTIIQKPGIQHLFDGYYPALCFGGMPSRKISL